MLDLNILRFQANSPRISNIPVNDVDGPDAVASPLSPVHYDTRTVPKKQCKYANVVQLKQTGLQSKKRFTGDG